MIINDLFYFIYTSVYFLLACFVFFILIYQSRYGGNVVLGYKKDLKLTFFFLISVTLLIGLRSSSVGTDTINYFYVWQGFWETSGSDFLLYSIMSILKYITNSFQFYLFFVAAIFYSVNYFSLRKISSYFYTNTLFLLFIFLSLFVSLSTSINVVRQGLSLSFFILALTYLHPFKRTFFLTFLLVAISFHYTTIIPVALLGVVLYFKNIPLRAYLFAYFSIVLLSAFGFSLLDFSGPIKELLASTQDKRLSYLEGKDRGYQTGFRLDFVIYNTFFLGLAILINKKLKDIFHNELLKLYCLCSIVFFMAFAINYSDRIGLFSWFLITPLLAPAMAKRFDEKLTFVVFTSSVFMYAYFFHIK